MNNDQSRSLIGDGFFELPKQQQCMRKQPLRNNFSFSLFSEGIPLRELNKGRLGETR